jgi:hypothetical protein
MKQIKKAPLQNIRWMSTIPSPDGSNNSNTQIDRSNKNSLSTHQQAKLLISKYGSTFIGTYLGVYFTTLVSLFGLLESGVLDVKMISVYTDALRGVLPFGHLGVSEISDGLFGGLKSSLWNVLNTYFPAEYIQNPHVSNLAVAWITVKFTEPLRLATTCLLVPRVACFLRRADNYL